LQDHTRYPRECPCKRARAGAGYEMRCGSGQIVRVCVCECVCEGACVWPRTFTFVSLSPPHYCEKHGREENSRWTSLCACLSRLSPCCCEKLGQGSAPCGGERLLTTRRLVKSGEVGIPVMVKWCVSECVSVSECVGL
jgi:hypothetical protein